MNFPKIKFTKEMVIGLAIPVGTGLISLLSGEKTKMEKAAFKAEIKDEVTKEVLAQLANKN